MPGQRPLPRGRQSVQLVPRGAQDGQHLFGAIVDQPEPHETSISADCLAGNSRGTQAMGVLPGTDSCTVIDVVTCKTNGLCRLTTQLGYCQPIRKGSVAQPK